MTPTTLMTMRSHAPTLICLTALLAAPSLGLAAAESSSTDRQTKSMPGKAGTIRVEIEKTEHLAVPLCPGGNISYTVKLTNNSDADTGPLDASISDPIPADTTYVQGSAGGGALYDAANNRISWNGVLAPGADHSISFSVVVNAGVADGTAITNRATGTLASLPVEVEVSSTVDCPPPPITLKLSKEREYAEPLCHGSNIAYRIELTNTSLRDNALTAMIEDPIPAGTTFAGGLSGGAVYDPAGDKVLWTGNLGPGDRRVIGFSVTVDEGVANATMLVNRATARLSDPVREDFVQDQAQVQDPVSCPPPPPLTMQLSKEREYAEPLCPGSNIFYRVRLTNTSARDRALDALIEDLVPVGTTFAGGLSTGADYDPVTNTVVWSGSLGPQESTSVGLSVIVDDDVPNGAQIVNRARAKLTDPVQQDFIQDQVEVRDPVDCAAPPIQLEISKEQIFDPPLCPGKKITYRVTLTNTSERDAALDASIEDPIPARTTYVEDSAAEGAALDAAANKIAWQGSLGPGDEKTIEFSVTVNDDVQNGTLIVNRAIGTLTDPRTQESQQEEDQVQGAVNCCRIRISGKVDVPAFPGSFYPISNARVLLYLLNGDPLPITPLSKLEQPPDDDTRTNPTSEAMFNGDRFPFPETAEYSIDFTFDANDEENTCPPRAAVASFLWDADERFAVTSEETVTTGDRHVPFYLARCVSDDARDSSAGCRRWQGQGNTFTAAGVDFTFGSAPTSRESARIISDESTILEGDSEPRASELWLPGIGFDPDILLDGAGLIYFYSYKAMQYFQSEADPMDLELKPVVVSVFGNRCKACYAAVPRPGFGIPGERDRRDDPTPLGRVTFGLIDTLRSHSDLPDNREWHELSHYWMHLLYGLNPRRPEGDCNHGGYYNAHTNDSLQEGFAMFGSMLIAEHYGDPQAFKYKIQENVKSLEVDYLVWSPFEKNLGIIEQIRSAAKNCKDFKRLTKNKRSDEDFAIAGLLWDLHDDGGLEPKPLGFISLVTATQDKLKLPASTIYQLLEKFHPPNAQSLYRHLRLTPGIPTSDLNQVFLAHGVFNDVVNRNLKHDQNEDIGPTGSSARPGRLLREEMPIISNAFLQVHFLDGEGNVVRPEEVTLDVRMEFEAPFEYYDYDFEVRPESNLIYIEMPPPTYDVKARIRAVGPEGQVSPDDYLLPNADFWRTVGSGADFLGEHTFELGGGSGEEACPADDARSLCLNDGRFQVEVEWRDFAGGTGSGQAVPFGSDDSGLFWFFNAENWEMLVKVLDGCGLNRRFWVFSAATTNVEYTLRVTDTETRTVKEYFNPLGNAAPAITDVDAFETCSGGEGMVVAVPQAVSTPEAAKRPDAGSTFALGKQDACTPGSMSLCLNEDRFRVEVDWRDHHGNTGTGQVVPFGSDDSGLFWFFNAENWEMLVKVLDGCGLNDRFWVFSAATTDVEYTLRVTDTRSGAVKEYFNPLGNAADAITDTDAFATCR